jgi:hypothetical protein
MTDEVTQLQPTIPADPQADFSSDSAGISAAVEAHRNTYESPIEQVRADSIPDVIDTELGINKGLNIREASAAITDKRQAQAEEAAKLRAALHGDEPDDVQAEARRLLEDAYERGHTDAGLSPEELRARFADPEAQAQTRALRERAEAAVAQSERLNQQAQQEQQRAEQAAMQERIANATPETFRQEKAILQSWWNRDLGGIDPNNIDHLTYLRQNDPARAQLAAEYLKANERIEQGYAQHQASVQFNQAAAAEDAKMLKAHPEIFRDHKIATTVQHGVQEMLCEELIKSGMARTTEDAVRQVQWAWNGGIPQMRTQFGQELLLSAYRQHSAAKLRSTARPVPYQVMRPGVAGSGISDREYGLKAANAKLDATGSLRAAQQLRAEQLRARRGNR